MADEPDTDPDRVPEFVPIEHTPPGGIPTIQVSDIVQRVSTEVASTITSQFFESKSHPEKTFLGFDWKNWIGWFTKGAVVVVVFLFTWYNTVNSSIDDRPTHEQAHDIANSAINEHGDHGHHPQIEEAIKAHDEQLRKLSDIQIEQTTVMKQQSETLGEIKEELRRDRRRNR